MSEKTLLQKQNDAFWAWRGARHRGDSAKKIKRLRTKYFRLLGVPNPNQLSEIKKYYGFLDMED